jgi:hypothetical protein
VAEETLATRRIQAMARGGHTRRVLKREQEAKKEDEAAAKIQRMHRRRRSVYSNNNKNQQQQQQQQQQVVIVEDPAIKQARDAAILIQSITRGRVARNRVSLLFNPRVNLEVFESTRIARFSAQDAARAYNRIAEELGPPRMLRENIQK